MSMNQNERSSRTTVPMTPSQANTTLSFFPWRAPRRTTIVLPPSRRRMLPLQNQTKPPSSLTIVSVAQGVFSFQWGSFSLSKPRSNRTAHAVEGFRPWLLSPPLLFSSLRSSSGSIKSMAIVRRGKPDSEWSMFCPNGGLRVRSLSIW